MNKIITSNNIKIKDIIYKIRDKQVMLSKNLAIYINIKMEQSQLIQQPKEILRGFLKIFV